MIGIQYAGGLGNRLFQHSFARVLQAEFGAELGTWQGKPAGLEAFPHTWAGLSPREVSGEAKILPFGNSCSSINATREPRMDLGNLALLLKTDDVLLHGYFQKYRYYQSHGRRLKKLFRMEPAPLKIRPASGDLVVYLQAYFNVGADFFLRQIAKTGFQKLWIMVNDLERGWDMVSALRKRFGGEIAHHSSYLTDFYFLQQAERMILAPSTFAWWAAFLSQAREVIFARPSEGFGSPTHGVADLEIRDDPRFRYVDYRV